MAQSSADWWYFGNNAGIQFTGGSPVAVLDGELSSTEGCASISDPFGNLLFYTMGDTVWDASHNIMPNGIGLFANGPGGEGSMNSFIVPRPGNPTEFYIFTVPSFNGGLYYSKVDMSLNAGLGDVVVAEKNITLIDTNSKTMEMVTSLRKPNNIDFWVISMLKPGDTAYAFEVTAAGVNTTPVVSQTGLMLDTIDQVGYLRGSQQNDRLAMTILKTIQTQVNGSSVHLFDFDNSTGQISYDLPITPIDADTISYGVEFSPSGQFLYVQSVFHSDLRQYDLNAGNAAAISASETFVGVSPNSSGGGALQLGPDGKIYVARNGNNFLASVYFPDNAGVLCGYNHDDVSLSGRQSSWGLPQFLPFFLQGELAYIDNCLGDTSFFTSNYFNVDSVLWTFGDPASGAADTSNSLNPFHIYSATGTYTVTHIAFDAFLSDTTQFEVSILPRQSLNLPNDTIVCDDAPITLDISQPGALSYAWNDGSTDSTFVASDTGLVHCTVFGVCDTVSDTMRIFKNFPLSLNIGNDTLICGSGTVTLGDSIPFGYSIEWNNGSNSSFITVAASDTFILVASSVCDTLVDTAIVVVDPLIPDTLLPSDTVVCTGVPFILSRPVGEGINFTWNDGTSALTKTVDTTATYTLTAFNNCGIFTDTFNALFIAPILTSFLEDTVICEEDTIPLIGIDSGATYIWSTGDTNDTIWTVLNESPQRYAVTITNGECQKVESIRIDLSRLACESIDCFVEFDNVITPNGDGLNDHFRITTDCKVQFFEMKVFNRWGQLVFQSNHVNHGWDGYINGTPAETGIYYFTVNYDDRVVVDADRKSIQGSLTLMR